MALNPIIKFTTLFGLLAVELAIEMSRQTTLILSGRLLRGVDGLRLALVLRDADRGRGGSGGGARGGAQASSCDALRSTRPPRRGGGRATRRPPQPSELTALTRALRSPEAAWTPSAEGVWTLSGCRGVGSPVGALIAHSVRAGIDVAGAGVPAQRRDGDLAALIPVEVALSLGAAHLVPLQAPELLSDRPSALHLVEAADHELGLTQTRDHDAARAIGGGGGDVDRKRDPLG